MRRRRKVLLLAFTALLLATAVVGLALAQSSAQDHDYDLAESMFGTNPDCPPGRVLDVSEWETLAEREAQFDQPDGVDLGTPPPLDFVEVVPDDPAPFLKGGFSQVPSGMIAVVPCIAVSPDRLALADDAANFFGITDSTSTSEG